VRATYLHRPDGSVNRELEAWQILVHALPARRCVRGLGRVCKRHPIPTTTQCTDMKSSISRAASIHDPTCGHPFHLSKIARKFYLYTSCRIAGNMLLGLRMVGRYARDTFHIVRLVFPFRGLHAKVPYISLSSVPNLSPDCRSWYS